MYNCRFSDNEGKEFKRLSKFDLFCCLSEDEDVLNPLRKLEKIGERPTHPITTHLLLIKGKIPPPCISLEKVSALILLAKKTPSRIDSWFNLNYNLLPYKSEYFYQDELGYLTP